MTSIAKPRGAAATVGRTAVPVLLAISLVHLLNDSMQAVVPALFPILEKSLGLSLAQVGWISFVLNMTASVMQPVVGMYTDKRSQPYLLPIGMLLSMAGMAGVALAPNFWYVLLSVMFIGLGSAVFHPESSRVVYLAAGGKRGFAQSVYQVGGNAGSSLAPIMTMFVFVPLGQPGAAWGMVLAAAGIAVLFGIIPWYRGKLAEWERSRAESAAGAGGNRSAALANHPLVKFAMTLVLLIVFARSWYISSIASYFQFYLERDYGLSVKMAQVPVFLFLAAGVVGTFIGGMLADKIGMKRMIVLSIVGSIPFALTLPYLPLWAIYLDIALLGFVLMAGFSVTVVYAQHLMPANVGMASGLTTGLAFGMGAIGAVVLGAAADQLGLRTVMYAASFLPLVGLLSLKLPTDRPKMG